VEGNIGAGKSTALQCLDKTGLYHVAPEPVDLWTDFHGHNVLGLFGSDPPKWGFTLQTVIYATLLDRENTPFSRPRILERSMRNISHVFGRNMAENGMLEPLQLSILEHLVKQAPQTPANFIYIRTEPEEAHRRAATRGRPEEECLPLIYFRQIHHLLDKWLLQDETDPVTVVDGSLPKDELATEVLKAVKDIWK
jgi:deoxyadenosine/deoxycytidine kinase